MSQSPYKVNVSSINDFCMCRFRWWAKWVMNLVPREEYDALILGKILHEIFEEHLRFNTPLDRAITTVRRKWNVIVPDELEALGRAKALTKLSELEEPLLLWTDAYPFEVPVLEVETPFEILHPFDDSIALLGRPDRVGILNDKIWHVQTKGLAPATNFGVWCDLAKRSYHEHVYAEALSQKYSTLIKPKLYGGTFFNLVRKLKYRTKVSKKNPEGEVKKLSEMFFQHPMSIDLKSPLHLHVMESVLDHAKQMRALQAAWENEGYIPAPNEKMNGGYYGNSPDIYFRVLVGEIELGDPQYFKKREDMYQVNGIDNE